MTAASRQTQDPIAWSAVWAVFFLALLWTRLGIPTRIMFDETHYVPAARMMLDLKTNNPEHPLLGKEIIAAAIALLGDKPLYWRLPSAILGAFGLFAFARALWWASLRPFATHAGMFLVATGFVWFVQSRIAMLDMPMACATMVALWMLAAAVRRPEGARWRLAVAGLCLGLAMASKWSVAPLLVLPGLTFLALKLKDNGARFLFARPGGPFPGITLAEAGLWLGLLPLAVYWASFAPAFFYTDRPVNWLDPIGHHQWMLQLQGSVTKPHPYQSHWYEWMGNWRPIWFLYQPVDGAQRGILLLGNPFSMLAGLAGAAWCLWAALWRKRRDALAVFVLYAVSIGFWALSNKPIQFYYHYLLPGTFLMACLALALDAAWEGGRRWLRWGTGLVLAVSAGMFVHFYPILSAAKLCCGKPSFAYWMWLDSWR